MKTNLKNELVPGLANKKILITGGAGFIGTSLAKKLYKSNDLLIIDNLRRNSFQYFKKEFDLSKIKFAVLDILDIAQLKGQIELFKPDIVLHLAAMAGVSDYYKSPVKTMEVNTIGTYNLLNCIKDLKLNRFIYFSTSEVYGPMVFGTKEDHNTTQGNLKQLRWTYGISKLAGEGFAFAYSEAHGIPVTSIRPFNIYGPGQVGEGAVQIFIRQAFKNEPIKVTGDGNQIRAWCYIDDFINGVIAILENNKAKDEIFNIGNPNGTSTILNLAKQIIKSTKSKSTISLVPHLGIDIDLRVPNISKAEELLGFKPIVDLEVGLQKSIEWYKKTNIIEPI